MGMMPSSQQSHSKCLLNLKTALPFTFHIEMEWQIEAIPQNLPENFPQDQPSDASPP